MRAVPMTNLGSLKRDAAVVREAGTELGPGEDEVSGEGFDLEIELDILVLIFI